MSDYWRVWNFSSQKNVHTSFQSYNTATGQSKISNVAIMANVRLECHSPGDIAHKKTRGVSFSVFYRSNLSSYVISNYDPY